jgi:ubiquinone/menaquinone biosynthesis C-methylase UbiE
MADLRDIANYWRESNIPQRWYSSKELFSVQWFNAIAEARYSVYYPYLFEAAEFKSHPKERVLEVGVGLGTDLVSFARHGALVYGIDLGADQVNYTKRNFNVSGLRFKQIKKGNAEKLPFKNHFFDLVYSFGVLHHTPDTQLALREVHRVLKKDGQAIVMLYARGWKHYLKRCLIHGVLLGKYFRLGSWQAVYNKVSEVNGNSPKTGVYTKKQVRAMFSEFSYIKIEKKRMGEFFDYKPYGTLKFPRFVQNFSKLLALESILGENWVIKAYKSPEPIGGKLRDVLFKHY